MPPLPQSTHPCPKCGKSPPPDDPHGLCSRCLIDSLIQSDDAPTTHSGDFASTQIPPPNPEADQLGRYHLREKLGEGGCGVVYLADQFEPVRRQVAFKLLKPGLDSREIISRFNAERQVLALLDHPNIAKVLDAGVTESGGPFFVMERVHGVPLTQFCEQNQLPLRNRLELFIQVCRALQHAHQKGIIHRDIKPSNILVAADPDQPVPKIIDFGIAKATFGALANQTIQTVVHQFLGTPAYMSPEQAGALPGGIDTRSDIYSLGVVLYELLTGLTPFDCRSILQQGFQQLVQTLRDVDPLPPSARLTALPPADLAAFALTQALEPSSLLHSLRGDLDWIVLKCLEKDPARRYETVNGLILDLLRHLHHEPILARPPTALYRFQKLVRRHRTAFWAGAATLTALIVGFAVSTAALFEARAQRNRAQQEQSRTRRALALAQTALAEAAYRAHDGAAVHAALTNVPADLRDSTWSYLAARADTSQSTFNSYFVGAAPDPAHPSIFAAAEAGQHIVFLNASTGQRVRQIQLSPRQFKAFFHRGLAFSPDGDFLAVGSLADGGIALYRTDTGELDREWAAPETDLLQFSPNGRWLLQSSSIRNQCLLWDASTGTNLWTLPSANRAVFNASGSLVIAGVQNSLVAIHPLTGQIAQTLLNLPSQVSRIAAHPNSPIVAFADTQGVLRVVDIQHSRLLYERPAHNGWVRGLAFTADGQRFVSAAETDTQRVALYVWDTASGTRLQSLLGGSSRPEDLRIHPLTDDLLVSGPLTKSWPLAQPHPSQRLAPGSTAAFFPDPSYCLASTSSGVHLVSLQHSTASATWSQNGPNRWKIGVSANAQVAASVQFNNSGGPAFVLRPRLPTLEVLPLGAVTSSVQLVRLSPSGHRLLLFAPGECNGHFDTRSGQPLPFLETKSNFRFIHDAAWLNSDRVLGAVTRHTPRGAPLSEEHLVTWDAHSGALLDSFRIDSTINSLALSPTADIIAHAGDEKTIQLRKTSSFELIREFRAHDASITALAWHPTFPILASASTDLTLKLWRLPEGHILQEIRGPAKPASMLHFSPDGALLVAAASDATCVWKLDPNLRLKLDSKN